MTIASAGPCCGPAPIEALTESGSGVATHPIELSCRSAELMLCLPDGRELRLDRTLSVGQSRRNDVALRDGCVSRRHCVLEVVSGRVMVRDLDSTNGTYVNGIRISRAELIVGAQLMLGTTRLRVIAPTAARQGAILGQSQAIHELRRHIAVLALTNLPVLIVGETGTGKELVARSLHEQSGRRGPFVPVNCGSLPKELIESELFGHERGAFTGASVRRHGVFQEADQGTLFLDEIGELPPALQPRLLRALENGMVRPVGANREVAVAARIVAATHVDLPAAVSAGRFRQDLYFRLVAAELRMPPLRQRAEDILLLARSILDEEAAQFGPLELGRSAEAALLAHSWPGNVRELRNVLRRAAALSGPKLESGDLLLGQEPQLEDPDVVRLGGRAYLEIEREVLERTLRRYGGNQRAAAHALRIPKSTLCDKARRYGLTGRGTA